MGAQASQAAAPLTAAEGKAVCVFVVDRTGSMGQWLRAVTAVLPSLVHSVAMTDVFSHIAVLTYSDYDLPKDRVVTFSGYHAAADPAGLKQLEQFAAAIPCEGGAGLPEAFKSALLYLAANPAPGAARTHVLHLTDAPPHCEPTLDNEGKKEKAALGSMWPWRAVVGALAEAHPALRYTALVTRLAPLYSVLALATGGDVVTLAGGTTASNIRAEIGRVMNGWLGLPDAPDGVARVTLVDGAAHDAAAQLTFGEVVAQGGAATLPGLTEADASQADTARMPGVSVRTCGVVAAALRRAVSRMKSDGPFRGHVMSELCHVLELDCMALTVSPIVGKLWRELCKARSDPRRDELIAVLTKAKAGLGADDKATMEAWLKESYNARAEIDADLVAFMKGHAAEGLLRFVPEDEALCAQQAVQLLARGDAKATAVIRAILSRMYVDAEATVPMIGSEAAAARARAKAAHAAAGEGEGEASSRHVDPAGDVEAARAAVAPMVKELATHDSFTRAALVVLPPAHVGERADRWRRGMDKAFGRWMPHLTLMFPFLPPSDFGAVVDAVTRTLGRADGGGFPRPFRVAAERVSWFPGRRAVLHVAPDDAGSFGPGQRGGLERIHAALAQLFPQQVRRDRDGFHAHLTLGQCAGTEAEAQAAAIAAEWEAAAWEVAEFHLIVHDDGAEAYRVAHTFALPRHGTNGATAAPDGGAESKSAAAAALLDGAGDDEDEEEELPLPAGAIPLNLPLEKFFQLALHTVAPGTQLTRRYAALLAMHAVQCGSVLAPRAAEYLESVKGRWINWRRREADQTAEVPENFGGAFLAQLLDPAVVAHAATEAERETAEHMRRVLRAMRFWHSLEVQAESIDLTSADGVFPGHVAVCATCGKQRALCLLAEDGVCGYCKKDKPEFPEADAAAVFQVRCAVCGAFYARDRAVSIPGNSKCHGCQKLDAPSPAVECVECGLRIVQFYNHSRGLPKGGRCGPCAAQCPPRVVAMKEHPALAHQVFGAAGHFPALLRRVGLRVVPCAEKAVALGVSTSLIDALLVVRPVDGGAAADDDGAEEEAAACAVAPADGVLFRERRPENAQALWDYVAAVMGGETVPERPECAVCMGPSADGRLVPACGRRGCGQRVCAECCRQWYGANRPGRLIFARATLCQFCARPPAPRVARIASRELAGLAAQLRAAPLAQDAYHAWCRTCQRACHVADRECVAAGEEALPPIADYECAECREGRLPAGRVAAAGGGGAASGGAVAMKECPACGVGTCKVSGCNHIACPCGEHWCWECAEYHSAEAGEVYAHMEAAHGTIWDFGAEFDEEDDGDVDYE